MKLIIKGKMFEALDTVTVTGEDGEVLYTLKRDKASEGHMVALCDANGEKLADIEQRGGVITKASFAVLVNGAQTALVERKPTIKPGWEVSGPGWEVSGPGWEVSGSLFSTKYKVTKDGETVSVLKVALLKSEIDIADEADLAAALAVVLAIRLMLYHASVIGATAAAVGTGAAVVNSSK